EVVVPEEKGDFVKWTGTKHDGTVVTKMIERPRYGGTYFYARDRAPSEWDGIGRPSTWNIEPVIETLSIREWTRGPGGTEEYDPYFNMAIPINEDEHRLAESWEVVDDTTLVWHIRKGVNWALDPTNETSAMVGGRKFTAEDVLYALLRGYQKTGYYRNRGGYLADMDNVENSIYISPDDPWAIVMKTRPGRVGAIWEAVGANSCQMYAPEAVEKYGNMADWRTIVGTGPFILKDHVGDSSITYVRNDNYWGTDPFFPENQTPYVDGIKVFIIPDRSTLASAQRTGKIDSMYDFNLEEAQQLLKTNPEMESNSYVSQYYIRISPRMDDPSLPWADVRVRHALMMAIDHPGMLEHLYQGEADLLKYPMYPVAEFSDIYVPIEDQSEIVQKMFGYHPDEAKQLLVEAGYPDGFEAEITCWSRDADVLSLIKKYWDDIGVDTKIDVRDYVGYFKMTQSPGRMGEINYKHMIMYDGSAANVFTLGAVRENHPANTSMVYDERVEKAFLDMADVYWDTPKRRAIAREMSPYLNEKAYHIQLPTPRTFGMWWPWLKGYYGGHYLSRLATFRFVDHIWVDQELKEEMGR
ncbi:ABC transporter substrate-binding protein, partial [Chloroflexota bacterium]